jgi:hypothetical protein
MCETVNSGVMAGCSFEPDGRACGQATMARAKKKTGVEENSRVLVHTGLLFDGPPGIARLPFVKSSANLNRLEEPTGRSPNSAPSEHTLLYAPRREKSDSIPIPVVVIGPDRFEDRQPNSCRGALRVSLRTMPSFDSGKRIHNHASPRDFVFVSRTLGVSARVNSTTSSPVRVLMS